MRNLVGIQRVTPIDAGIDLALPQATRLVREEQFEQCRRPERVALIKPQTHTIDDLPIESDLVRRTAAVRIDVGVSSRRIQRQLLDAGLAFKQWNIELGEKCLGRVLARGNARKR